MLMARLSCSGFLTAPINEMLRYSSVTRPMRLRDSAKRNQMRRRFGGPGGNGVRKAPAVQ
jgi:hypothetical protein